MLINEQKLNHKIELSALSFIVKNNNTLIMT